MQAGRNAGDPKQPLFQEMDDRAAVPRRKGPALWDGLSSIGIGEPLRRDHPLLISAFATTSRTLLGAVGESLGMDRLLKSNTSKTRTHSLFPGGGMLHELIPNMPKHRLLPLLRKFTQAVSSAGVFLPITAVSK